jgi:hypothetical protein
MRRLAGVSRPPIREAPARRPRVLVEVLVLLSCIAVFTYLHAAVGEDIAAATANAHTLQSVEESLHLNIERATNEWLASHATWVQVTAVAFYRAYYLVILGVLVWVYVRHAEVYLVVRRTLVAIFLLILPVYWALPMSPPRFAQPGVVDIVAAYSPIGSHAGPPSAAGQNLTAMPSNHVALSAWCAFAVWYALRTSHPKAAWAAWLYPLAMTAVVFSTGNHYVLDVVGSAVLLAASVGAAVLWGRFAASRDHQADHCHASGRLRRWLCHHARVKRIALLARRYLDLM